MQTIEDWNRFYQSVSPQQQEPQQVQGSGDMSQLYAAMAGGRADRAEMDAIKSRLSLLSERPAVSNDNQYLTGELRNLIAILQGMIIPPKPSDVTAIVNRDDSGKIKSISFKVK